MDFMLSEEEIQFKEQCQHFATEILTPISNKYGETDDLPSEMIRAMADAEFFKLLIPEELGGKGIKALNICLAREVLAGVYCPADVTLAMQGLGSYPIFLAGNGTQKEKYLPRIGNGELLTTYALTEPEAGSDVNGIKSHAEETSNGFLLNGQKRFISNGHAAGIVIVFAKTPLPENARAISAFVVEKGMEGFKVSKRIKVMAPHDLVELEFTNCHIPKENLLGELGDGYQIAMKTLDLFRMSVGAAAVGIGQTALSAAKAYAKERVQFGSPIATYQAVQFKLAGMATELDAARGFVYRAAIKLDRGDRDLAKSASMAKLYATEAAFRAVDEALQIHGGLGVVTGTVVERLYREIRSLRIYEGTSEIQRLIIANSILKE
jgi:acyl-CoA dehydrogenase